MSYSGIDGTPTVPNVRHNAKLVDRYRRLNAQRTELTAAQAAVIQAVDDARRLGEITNAQAAEIEQVIRRGQVTGARKRLTRARQENHT